MTACSQELGTARVKTNVFHLSKPVYSLTKMLEPGMSPTLLITKDDFTDISKYGLIASKVSFSLSHF